MSLEKEENLSKNSHELTLTKCRSGMREFQPTFFLIYVSYITIDSCRLQFLLTNFVTGIGYAMLVLSFLCCVYYNTIIAWSLYYLFLSFRSDVPWRSCGNWWNRWVYPSCRLIDSLNPSSICLIH